MVFIFSGKQDNIDTLINKNLLRTCQR